MILKGSRSSRRGSNLQPFAVRLCVAYAFAEQDWLRWGVQSLAIRIAKRLNHLWRRVGQLFADRYHDHILRTPREVRNALAYVLENAAHHGIALIRGEPDPFSSARWLVGKPARGGPICNARTWSLSAGRLRLSLGARGC